MKTLPPTVNWLTHLNFPERKTWFRGSHSVALSPNGVDLFCAMQGINKAARFGKNERHELLLIGASTVTGAFWLAERYVQRQDFEHHLGGVALLVFPNNQLHVTVAMDEAVETKNMFQPESFQIDGNVRKDVQTYKVT